MNSSLRVRRATVDDLETLKKIWDAMRLPADELEKRLTEFQVVTNAEGEVLGAIGVQILRQHALLHSEDYSDYSITDAARELFLERIQTLAANHGVFRLWTQERSPFWKSFGFRPPQPDTLERLPNEWRSNSDDGWLTLELKDEAAINAALENKLDGFMDSEKEQTARLAARGQFLKKMIIIAGFGIFFICLAIVSYILFHRHGFMPTAK